MNPIVLDFISRPSEKPVPIPKSDPVSGTGDFEIEAEDTVSLSLPILPSRRRLRRVSWPTPPGHDWPEEPPCVSPRGHEWRHTIE